MNVYMMAATADLGAPLTAAKGVLRLLFTLDDDAPSATSTTTRTSGSVRENRRYLVEHAYEGSNYIQLWLQGTSRHDIRLHVAFAEGRADAAGQTV